MSTDLTGLIPHGWSGGEAVTKWWRGKHLHLYRLRKNCAQCGKEMVIDVTKAAIAGTAKNAGLHLTRCPDCRAVSKGEGGTSRPTIRSDAPLAADVITELEMLRTANVTMKEELEGLYMQLKELRGQQRPVETVGFRPPAKPPEPVTYRRLSEPLTMAQSVKNMQAALAAKNNEIETLKSAKMPWEGG